MAHVRLPSGAVGSDKRRAGVFPYFNRIGEELLYIYGTVIKWNRFSIEQHKGNTMQCMNSLA